jgi:hypothetical protein
VIKVAGSFENINYRLRPAKNVERKMMADIFQRLPHIRPLKDYKYIGFGSTFFSDIRLIHRRLGIKDIISIEREESDEPRFELNKPYDCVRMEYGRSKEILPELEWDKATILWLDYDDEIALYMFSDIREFMTKAPAGSVIFVTINAHPTSYRQLEEESKDDEDRTMVDELRENLGREYIPADVERKDLRGWGYGRVCRRIILNQIEEIFLPDRNEGENEEDKVEFRQLVNFRYSDGAKMRTIGGILASDEVEEALDASDFEDLFFIRRGEKSYEIDPPTLTFAEMRVLDKELPGDPEDINSPVPDSDIRRYSDIYRYFPRFVESEL